METTWLADDEDRLNFDEERWIGWQPPFIRQGTTVRMMFDSYIQAIAFFYSDEELPFRHLLDAIKRLIRFKKEEFVGILNDAFPSP